MADTELLGAQEACILDDATVVVTRGGLNDAWEPLDLTSHLVWLDGQDLSWEGELTPSEGPSLPSQEVTVVDGIVYVAVNNGWSYTEEVGRMGRWDPMEGTYEEWDLGEAAKNPVAIHVHDGALFTVNNGDWTSTSVSRVALDDLASVETVTLQGVSAGCNASAFVESKLAVQISGESGLRLLDSPTMAWEEGEVLNQAAPSAYSLAVHPQYGWTFARASQITPPSAKSKSAPQQANSSPPCLSASAQERWCGKTLRRPTSTRSPSLPTSTLRIGM